MRPDLLLGFTGALLLVASFTAVLFDVWGRTSAQSGLAALPIALWELSLGAWLIAKGFKPSPDDAG